MKIRLIPLLATIIGFGAIGCGHHVDDIGGTAKPKVKTALDTVPTSESAEPNGDTASGDEEVQAATENAVARSIIVNELDLLGEWDGDPGIAMRAFVYISQGDSSDGTFQVDFVVYSETRSEAVVRLAKFENGILRLNEPVEDKEGTVGYNWGICSELPFSALLAVHTDRGDFLVPATHAAVMKTVDELKPGFAYQRTPTER